MSRGPVDLAKDSDEDGDDQGEAERRLFSLQKPPRERHI